MRARRILLAIISLAWFGAVYWFWDQAIPVVPTSRIPLSPGKDVLGFLKSGELIIARKAGERVRSQPQAHLGPLEFWQFPQGRKTRELLTDADRIEAFIHESGESVVTRDGQSLAINVNDGRTLGVLPSSGPITSQQPLDSGRRMVYLDGDTLRLWDFDARSEVWSAPGHGRVLIPIGSHYLFAEASDRPGRYVVVDLDTGQRDTRFDQFNNLLLPRFSDDGRYVGIETQQGYFLCDAESFEVLWSLRKVLGEMFYFEKGGREVAAAYCNDSGRIVVARWNAADGQVITPKPDTKRMLLGFRNRWPMDSPYAIDKSTWSPPAIDKLNRWLKKSPMKYRIPDWPKVSQIVDVETNNLLGFLPGDLSSRFDPQKAGFAVTCEGAVEYYSFPPARNWPWLLTWGFLPPAAVWTAAGIIHRLRHPRAALIQENPAPGS